MTTKAHSGTARHTSYVPTDSPQAIADTAVTKAKSDRDLPTLTHEEILRYSRHLILPDVGVEGQRKLKAARVLLIGAGGLGSPLALYLSAAGVGKIGLVDFDVVEVGLMVVVVRAAPPGHTMLASTQQSPNFLQLASHWHARLKR